MADVSKIKLPDGTTYNIKDTTSGYITPSAIADKTDKLIVHLGDQISGDYYQIDKTYSEIGWAVLNGDHLLFSDGNAVYPYLGFGNIDGTVLIEFGFSATYNGTAMLHGYAVLQNNTAMKLHSFTDIPTSVSQLTNDSGFITSYTETDPTVPSWAKASTKPTYTASEVGALSGNSGGVFYGTCSTAAGTVAKVVECADFTADNLKAGAIIIVTFTATNIGAVANLTMNVNSTGAKPIKYINNGTLGNLTSAGYIKAGTEYPFYYDGANWVCWFNVNTTYSALSEADMHTGTATTARLITAQRLKQAVQYHAPVTSVNGSTGDVTVTVPTKTSDLENDGDGSDGTSYVTTSTLAAYITNDDLAIPHFYACDSTTSAVLQQAFGVSAGVCVPEEVISTALLLLLLESRTWFAWMHGAELEFARLSISVNTSNSAITLYLRGRTSIATGVMGVDSSWMVTPLASDAEGVAY